MTYEVFRYVPASHDWALASYKVGGFYAPAVFGSLSAARDVADGLPLGEALIRGTL